MKKIGWLFLIFLLVGCSNKELEASYHKMQIANGNINGYILDLRIYGSVNNEKINEIIRISNYRNSDYEIRSGDHNTKKDDIKIDNTIYIKDGKAYHQNENNQYIETEYTTLYKNPAIYLEGLKSIAKIINVKEEVINDKTYKLYKVKIKKDTVKRIIADTAISSIDIKDDVESSIYIDKDNYVYRIIYNLEGITINANYFGINTTKAINIQNLSTNQ